jgi:hypothetical protein
MECTIGDTRSTVVCCHSAKTCETSSKEGTLADPDTIRLPRSELEGTLNSGTSGNFIAFKCIIDWPLQWIKTTDTKAINIVLQNMVK